MLVALRSLEQVQPWLRSALGESKGARDSRYDQGGITDGSEGDQVHAIREVGHQVPSDFERETCFAYASRAGEGEQAHIWAQEQRVDRLYLLLTTNQRSE